MIWYEVWLKKGFWIEQDGQPVVQFGAGFRSRHSDKSFAKTRIRKLNRQYKKYLGPKNSFYLKERSRKARLSYDKARSNK